MERDLAADVATVQLNVTTLVHLTGRLHPSMRDRTGTESCGEVIHIVPAPTSPRSESRIRHRQDGTEFHRAKRIRPASVLRLCCSTTAWSLGWQDPAITSRRGM